MDLRITIVKNDYDTGKYVVKAVNKNQGCKE